MEKCRVFEQPKMHAIPLTDHEMLEHSGTSHEDGCYADSAADVVGRLVTFSRFNRRPEVEITSIRIPS